MKYVIEVAIVSNASGRWNADGRVKAFESEYSLTGEEIATLYAQAREPHIAAARVLEAAAEEIQSHRDELAKASETK